jgi:hypothetical protein
MSYKQLNLKERHYIEIEIKKGTFQRDIQKPWGETKVIFRVS